MIHRQMVQTPTELNQIGEDLLSERVNAVLGMLCELSSTNLPAIAPFMTADVMLRIHNLVEVARQHVQPTNGQISWSKQAILAVVVGSFTGVKICRADAEHVGNAEDSFLRNYTIALKKARQALANAQSKAKKSGREIPAYF